MAEIPACLSAIPVRQRAFSDLDQCLRVEMPQDGCALPSLETPAANFKNPAAGLPKIFVLQFSPGAEPKCALRACYDRAFRGVLGYVEIDRPAVAALEFATEELLLHRSSISGDASQEKTVSDHLEFHS